MSRRHTSPDLLRGFSVAAFIAAALSLIAGLCLPFIMCDLRAHPVTLIDADLPPLAPEIRPALLMCPICGSPCTPMKINLMCDHGHTVEHTAEGKAESRKRRAEIQNPKSEIPNPKSEIEDLK